MRVATAGTSIWAEMLMTEAGRVSFLMSLKKTRRTTRFNKMMKAAANPAAVYLVKMLQKVRDETQGCLVLIDDQTRHRK